MAIQAILTIPTELRLQIYALVLSRPERVQKSHRTSLLSVNRQIRHEVLHLILLKSRYFGTLKSLWEWTSDGSPELLQQVKDVSVSIFKGSLCPPPDPVGALRIDSTPEPGTGKWWEAQYVSQFGRPGSQEPTRWQKLQASLPWPFQLRIKVPKHPMVSTWESFQAISEVRRLWIHLQSFIDSAAARGSKYADEQQLILEMISTCCPKVEEFTVMSRHTSLQYLKNFPNLRRLHFSGYSRSTPEETLEIMKGFNRLEELVLYRYPHNNDDDQLNDNSNPRSYVSLHAEVLAGMNPLKVFRLWHMRSDNPSQHLTMSFIKALKVHQPTLRKLQIVSDRPVNGEVLEALLDFIVTSSVVDLEVKLKAPFSYASSTLADENLKLLMPRTAKACRASFSRSTDREYGDLKMMATDAKPSSELADYDLQIDWNR
ncbi:hypothetical protein BGZ60DRAFT_404087 [Tricladium varicosporioides]|nr:hypothetical protein BGZ60DRAFT_404087 [Hymenoscyphus varicosporioides]